MFSYNHCNDEDLDNTIYLYCLALPTDILTHSGRICCPKLMLPHIIEMNATDEYGDILDVSLRTLYTGLEPTLVGGSSIYG